MVKAVEYRGKPSVLLKVIPGASKNEVAGIVGDCLKVKVNAPPERGKANKELLCFLAKIFEVRKSELSLVGITSRTKRIIFENSGFSEIDDKLARYSE